IIRTYYGDNIEVPQLYNIYKIKYDSKTDAKDLAEMIAEDPSVDFAEPNYLVYTMNTTPNDPLYSSQWHFEAVNAPRAWDIVTGDTTQIIGIIDTGVDWDHPDLDDNIWTNWDEIPGNGVDDDGNGYIDDIRGWDFVNNDNDPNDDNSHGTHVAGIAAAEGDNGIGVSGMAWNARILPVKMLQSSGSGNSSDLASAITYAADNGATVINMSLGSYGESMTVKTALENAYAYAVLVAAAGNDERCICSECLGCGTMYPACYSFVIGVEATTQSGVRASFSNYDPSGPIVAGNPFGHNYELKAPGVGIYSTFPNGNYNSLNGTSMAAPIIAGAIALMKEHDPTQSTEQIFAKLIQGANNGILDIYNSLNYILIPDLYFVEYTLIDTLPGCDNDGIADAGENIQIYLDVRNAGGWADSVWSKIRFGQFEDTTTANILDSTSYIGDISAHATLTGELDHFYIKIDSNVVNDRDIVFEYEIGCSNSSNKLNGQIILTIQNGAELLGIMDSTLTLTPDKLWIINGSFKVGNNGILNILPNTTLILNQPLVLQGKVNSLGKKDSLIHIYGPSHIEHENSEGTESIYTSTVFSDFSITRVLLRPYHSEFYFCKFINNTSNEMISFANHCIFKNCEFVDNHVNLLIDQSSDHFVTLNNCNFDNNKNGINYSENAIIKNCNISRIYNNNNVGYIKDKEDIQLTNNNFLTSNNINVLEAGYQASTNYLYHENNYWGTNDPIKINNKIYDFFEDATLPQVIYQPILFQPSDSAHGCVWKFEIDGIDPQDSILGPIGVGIYQFDVFFNKCMDTAYAPLLSFGVRDPHTQHFVSDNASWSADSSIWTAYYTIGLETGDGMNYIRVSGAVDTAGFDIPVEDNERFTFVIQAAGAASINFIAIPGIGKVELEWPEAATEDILGYNMYRMLKLTDSTYSDTFLINNELITDTIYTDYAVIPDSTYKYLYKIVGTDLVESDFSKAVSAIPFDAANGDANGDLSVNVLDITTIVSYMLNQNPTPFIFDAADVNGDNTINVLDIIGVVQLISGGKSVPISKLIGWNNDAAVIFLKEDMIRLRSKENIAALQFELFGENLDQLKLFCKLEGFEFAHAVSGDKIICVLYSFKEIEILGGLRDILKIERNEATLEWGDIIAGDLNGDYVPVYKEIEQRLDSDDITFTAHPNPFDQSTLISYSI
ncbi:MAG: S8 family serine peptidase, partial [Bacteroidales bacterium]|nr:S8 family serine peptidase [Bacteroidales bacterium]